MDCYIINRRTFKVRAHAPAARYRIVLNSIYDEVSDFEFALMSDKDVCKNDFIYADCGYLGIVSELSSDNSLSVKCSDAINIFLRPMFIGGAVTLPAERFIESVIDVNFKYCSDAYFALPFLDVKRLSDAAGIVYPDQDDYGVWDLKSYVAKARRVEDVYTTLKPSNGKLEVEIVKRAPKYSKIDFSDKRHCLLSENYSKSGLNKITVYCEETGAYSDWYLLDDGTVTRDYKTSGRYDGGWECMTVKAAAEAEQAVYDRFLSRAYSHLIEFSSPRELEFYQRVDLRLNDRVLKTYISGIEISSDSECPVYKTGEMRVRFTDRLKELI